MFRSTFYMRTGTQRKMSAYADGCPAREQGSKCIPARFHTGTQRKIYRKSNDLIQERSSWV